MPCCESQVFEFINKIDSKLTHDTSAAVCVQRGFRKWLQMRDEVVAAKRKSPASFGHDDRRLELGRLCLPALRDSIARDFSCAAGMAEFRSSRIHTKENGISIDVALNSTELLVQAVHMEESLKHIKRRLNAMLKLLS